MPNSGVTATYVGVRVAFAFAVVATVIDGIMIDPLRPCMYTRATHCNNADVSTDESELGSFGRALPDVGNPQLRMDCIG